MLGLTSECITKTLWLSSFIVNQELMHPSMSVNVICLTWLAWQGLYSFSAAGMLQTCDSHQKNSSNSLLLCLGSRVCRWEAPCGCPQNPVRYIKMYSFCCVVITTIINAINYTNKLILNHQEKNNMPWVTMEERNDNGKNGMGMCQDTLSPSIIYKWLYLSVIYHIIKPSPNIIITNFYLYSVHKALNLLLVEYRRNGTYYNIHRHIVDFFNVVRVYRPILKVLDVHIWLCKDMQLSEWLYTWECR